MKRITELLFCLIVAYLFWQSLSTRPEEIQSSIFKRVGSQLVTLVSTEAVSIEDLEFSVSGRDVTIAGLVEDFSSRDAILSSISETPGVRVVKENLKVPSNSKVRRTTEATTSKASVSDKESTNCFQSFAEFASQRKTLFASDSNSIQDDSSQQLRELSRLSQECTENQITIVSRLRPTSDTAKDRRLASKRVEAVVNALRAYGIDDSRLATRTYVDERLAGSEEEENIEFLVEERL